MRHGFLALLLLLTLPLRAQDYSAQLREFEDFAAQAMKAQYIPGLSVAVMKGDFVWSKGFGLADVENNVPATAESSYRLASITKPMTAVGILTLVEQGKVDLDAEVHKYVSYFPRKEKPITVRQLLSHLGGISHYRNYAVEGHFKEPKDTRTSIAVFENFELVAEPGTRYSYSTYGYNLLGAVIESVSGTSYDDYMNRAVWKPLGMTSTRMDHPRRVIPNRVRGYEVVNGELRNSEYVDISSRFAGGGTRSTVRDLIRFVDGIAEGKLLKPQTIEQMWTTAATRDGMHVRYGLGWDTTPRNGRFVVSHGGSQQETRTLLMYFPRERFAVALASNLESANLNAFAERLIDLFLGDAGDLMVYAADRVDRTTYQAIASAFTNGLAYYDRHGKPITTDPKELAKAVDYFKRVVDPARITALEGQDTLLLEGRHPKSGEMFTKLGSYMAGVLAARGNDLRTYHKEGELRFFEDYLSVAKAPVRFDRALSDRVSKWRAEWARVATPELRRMNVSSMDDLPALEKLKDALTAATLRPDFSFALVELVENRATAGDFAGAVRAAQLAESLYPASDAATGALGILTLLGGNRDAAVALLRRSVQINPNGYAGPRNLINVASALADTPMRAGAVALLELGTQLHPHSKELKAQMDSLKASR